MLPSLPNHLPTHLVKSRHRLIRTPNLHLEERRFLPITSLLWTLHLRLLRIIPRTRSTKNILSLLPHKCLSLEIAFLQDILVGTSLALQSVHHLLCVIVLAGGYLLGGGADCEDVAAGGAD